MSTVPAEATRDELRRLIDRFGWSLIDEPARLRALLRDTVGQYRLEISLLVGAAEDGVPKAIAPSVAQGLPPGMIERLAGQLENNRGFSPGNARWAVEAWAAVLADTIPVTAVSSAVTLPAVGEPTKPAAELAPPQDPPLETPVPTSLGSAGALPVDPVSADPISVDPTAEDPTSAEPDPGHPIPAELSAPSGPPPPAPFLAKGTSEGSSPVALKLDRSDHVAGVAVPPSRPLTARTRTKRRRMLILGLVIALLAAGLVGWRVLGDSGPTGTAGPPVTNVHVPKVVGLSTASAQQELGALGLTYVVNEQESEGQAGRVLKQQPTSGSSVPAGTSVALTVSTKIVPVRKPTLKQPTSTATQVPLRWTLGHAGSPVGHFLIVRNGTPVKQLNGARRTYVDVNDETPISPGSSYTYVIWAVGQNGTQAHSAPVTVTIPNPNSGTGGNGGGSNGGSGGGGTNTQSPSPCTNPFPPPCNF